MSNQKKTTSCYNDSFRAVLPETSSLPLFADTTTTQIMNEVVIETVAAFRKAIENGEIKLEEITHSPFGGKPLLPLSEIDRFALPFGSWLCPDSGLVVTSPRIKETSLPLYYEKYYHPMNYGKREMSMQQSLFAAGQGEKVWDILKPYLQGGIQKKLEVLEIGAGLGDVLNGLQNKASRDGIEVDAVGTEFSSQCKIIAQNRGIKMIAGGFQEALALNKRYDIVILSHVFEHLTNLGDSMEYLHQLLAPKGLLYIEVPGIMALNRRPVYDFNFIRYSIHAHIYNFNLTSLAYILKQGRFHLLSGNEECEAIFSAARRDEDIDTLPIEENAQLVYSYLHRQKKEANQLQAFANEYHNYRSGYQKYKAKFKKYKARNENQEQILNSRWRLFRRIVGAFLPQWIKNAVR